MRMVCLGLNHRTAPVEIRERFAVPAHKLREEGRRIRSLPEVDQCVVLSTCNRMEIYYWSNAPENAQEHILSHFLGDGRGELDMASYFYSHQGEEALGHLCRVLSGLDSMVLGETEIFGQVKTAYQTALDAGVTAACANKTFQKAFTIGKKVRTESRGYLRGVCGGGAGGTNFRRPFRHPRPYSGGGRDEPRYGARPACPGR